MPHFFVSTDNVTGGRFVLGPEESGHLVRVLRRKVGDVIGLFDGKDTSWRGTIDRATPTRVEGVVSSEVKGTERRLTVRLLQGLPRGERFEWVLEKATELGVAEIVPVLTRRSVATVPSERVGSKMERWNKIVRAAAQQCGRVDCPRVVAPISFTEAVGGVSPQELILMAWEGENEKPLRDVLRLKSEVRAVNVMIGPEGGFDPSEVVQAQNAGAVTVSLGSRILRTETAGLFVLSVLNYEYD